ncbi:AAA-like domain-containing protein [Phormidium tenue FACHB-886]|nr:AAA-like domain-containing protein [Phormidium tenue FACHB-886]
MTQQSLSQRRKRGVILSSQGWQRLQTAEQRLAEQNNVGKPYTLEQLGELTDLSPNTITKVRRRQLAVDRQTLELYFNAFNLNLNANDYISLDPETANQIQFRRPLQGQLSIDSPFYVDRPPVEQIVYEEVMQPGALIRIKAPHNFGKTSLIIRTLASMQDKDLQTVILNLQLADKSILKDLDQFLRWFCAVVSQSLKLPNKLDEYWDEIFGSSYNCTRYFESYVLPELNSPLVLALDSVDLLFNVPNLATDFFGMLRAWHEKSRYGSNGSSIWQQFRLVVMYSTETGSPLELNQSPFNLGFAIELLPFNFEQITDLAQRYNIESAEECAAQVLDLVGGLPYLTQLSLYYLATKELTPAQLSQQVDETHGIFASHLRQQLALLQFYPELLMTLEQILHSRTTDLSPIHLFKLQGMGLIRLENLQAMFSCTLYQQYFSRILKMLSAADL